MEGGELDFVSQLLRDLRVDGPWVPPKTWESIPSESGRAVDATPAYPAASASPEFVEPSGDPLVVSETVLVRLVLNALQGVKSALVDIDKASSVFASSPADRTFHRIPNLWHRSSSMLTLGRLLKSIGYSGLVFFLLRKFVNYFLGTEQRPTIPYQDKNTENRNQYGNVSEENYLKSHVQDIPKGEFAGKPPYTLVNQAFAVAVRKILEGYLSALNTIFASVKYRRSLKGVDESKFISHNVGSFPSAISEITLLEVYLHTRELRTRIETLGHICGIRINDFAFAEFSTEDFSSRMNLEYSSFPRGADLLTYLYVQLRDADLIHRPLLKFLFLRSYEPYSLFIRSWIFKGRINDPYEEFVVEYSEKASSLCGTSSHCIKEREHASIPRFLKRVCTPLLRAGQQFLVLMKLQDLCNPSAIREDNFGRINLCCDLTSLEDVLPHYSDSSSDSVPSFSLLTFNNKDAEAMLQKRESMYSLLYEKLKIYFEKLDVRFQPIKNTVIPYGDILFYSDEREHVDNQDTSVVENLVSSPSSIDGFTSGDICLKDTDSSSTSDGSLNEMDLEKTSEDSFFTRSEANREFECNFIHDIPVESTNFPALLLQAYHGPERIYRAASTSEKLEALVSSSPRKPEIFVEKYNTSDENDTVNSQGGVNPNMSRFPLRIDAPKCDKNKIVRPFNEDSLFRRPWLLQRLPLNHISANQEYESKSPFLYTETDEIVESHQIENFTAGKRYTLDNLKLDQDARTNTFSDGHVTSAKDFVSHSWTVECNYDLSRNPVIAKAPWLNSLMCSQRSLLPYFDFSSAEDPVQAFSKRLASQSRRVLQDHHHVPMNPVSGHVIRCISDSVPVPQANESGFDSSAPFDGRSYTSHFLGDLSKNVSGGASWERLMMRSCVDVRSNCGGRSCATASTSDLPLDVVIDKCIVQEILHQYVYISNFTIKLLEEGFDLHEHLSALRRYYFMELADWADSFLVSLWNHKWSVSEPGNMSAEIQRFLLVALQRSSCESDPYHERLYIYEKDQSVMPSSFSAIGTFDFIGLGYRIDWPISIIVTQDALRVYTEIFSFLLDVRLAVFSLSSMWRSLKALGRSNASGRHLGGQEVENFNIFLGIRQQVNHFVSSLQQYLQSQLSDVSWCRFLISLKQEVNDMLDLESVHMSYLADAQNICFLSAGAREIAKIIRNILQCALDLRACLKASPPETGLDGPDSLTMLDRVNFPRALAVRSAFRKNLRELYLHYLRSPKHSEFSLCRFWCCLDYNGYYSNEISRGTGR